MRWAIYAALCSFAVANGVPVCAQETAPTAKKAPLPGTLHSVSVKGNHLYSSEDIIKETGLRSGQHVTGPVLDQARAKLQSTELFNDVAYAFRYSGGAVPDYDVTFTISENEQV